MAERGAIARALILAALMTCVAFMAHAQPIAVPATGDRGPQAVKSAFDTIKADPNLATERTVHMLRWRKSNAPRQNLTLPQWILQLIRTAEESSRLLVWAVVLLAAGLLAAYLVRIAFARSTFESETLTLLPTHVRELDIRPESLPHDIGAAARALWDRGERRAALALLYRGALSRLVHVHRVPIRDSSTEGDCLRLARGILAPAAADYVSGLIATWQRSVYGHQLPESERVYGLCLNFDPALARARHLDLSGDRP